MKRRSNKSVSEPAGVQYESRSLAKGLQILEAIAAKSEPLALRDLSELASLGKASTLRLLRTLQHTGYLDRDVNDRYSLARAWPSLAMHNRLRAVRDAATPVLQDLTAEMGETVALAFLFEDVIRVIEVIESTHHIRMSNYRGGVLQPYASSLGKCITAHQGSDMASRLLYTYGIFSLTENTQTDFRAIQVDLASVRERGYAWDREETVPGGICIGAPILAPGGEVYSAISMSMPKARFTKRLEDVLPQMIVDYAARVSKALQRALTPESAGEKAKAAPRARKTAKKTTRDS